MENAAQWPQLGGKRTGSYRRFSGDSRLSTRPGKQLDVNLPWVGVIPESHKKDGFERPSCAILLAREPAFQKAAQVLVWQYKLEPLGFYMFLKN